MSVFQCNVFQHNVFQNDCGGEVSTGGVGRLVGRNIWKPTLAPPWLDAEESVEYRRLKRKLAMLEEHLLDARGSEIDVIERKIREIKRQIELL